ncbi:phage tail tape measure protein [Streptococcus hyovaginalis]|uniref:phage tail tape measure protein n=1 Tax=Streptococcus hyovaginalis TaxID=149015 RepID=UPI002A80D412|nr:phage tail tape measure protein [Streptococcus hyovaginalis]MDY4510976.1 phage tail tape measure protein [Streptococcus hyovaginalis]
MPSGTPLGNMYIELGLDTSQFASDVNGAKRAVNFFKAETRALDSALKGNGKSVDLLNAKHKTLKQTIEAQKKVLDGLKKNFDNLEPGTAKWERAAVQIERENAKLAQMEGELGRVEGALVKVHAQNSRWGQASAKLEGWSTHLKSAGDRLSAIGDAMKPFSLMATAGLGLATKKAIDFEGQMQTTKALLSDTTSSTAELNAQTSKLGEASKGWAKEYGISTAQINEGMQELIKGGLDANQTMGAMPAILRASKATGEDFNGVMNAATSIMSQFGLTSSNTNTMLKNTNRVTDSLSFVANKTKAGFMDMGNAMVYVGPVAKSVGMDIEETAAAVGLLSNAGIAGEKAGTALRGALTRLLKPSKANAEAMKELGFSSEEFRSGAIDLPDVLDRIKESTKGMTEADKAALIAKAFGTEAQSAMNALVDQGGDSLRNLTKETKSAKGYTKDLADEMMKGSKAGVAKFKGALEVLQITIGQKLLPILTPLIEKATDAINAFADLPEPAQNAALALVGLTAVGAPLLKFLGSTATNLGTVVGWLGKLAGKKAAADALTAVGTSAQGAVGSAGLLNGKLGALATTMISPVGLVAGAALLAGGLVALGKAKDYAREKAEEWGTTLDGKTKTELNNFKAKVDETNTAIVNFDAKGTPAVGNVKKAFADLFAEIEKSQVSANSRLDELGKKLGLTDEQIQKGKDRNKQIVENAKEMTDQINAIYDKHNGDVSKLTAAEKAIVENNQKELINARLSLMNVSNKQEMAIRQAFSNDISTLNETQLKKTMTTLEKAITAERKAYKQKNADLKEALEAGTLTQKAYNDMKAQNKAEHEATMDALGEKYAKAAEARDAKARARLRDNTTNYQVNAEKAKKFLQDVGLSYDKLANKVDAAAKKGGKGTELLAQSTANMTKETKEANALWTSLTFDEKKMEVKSNAIEEVVKASQSEEGWNQLMFMMKEANLTTNARMEVAEALRANGDWNDMTPKEKKLVVDGQKGLLAIAESKKHLEMWNSMPEKVKQLLGENKDFTSKADTAKAMLEHWNSLSPEAKKLYAENLTQGGVAAAKWEIDQVEGKNVLLDATDNTLEPTTTAKANVDSVKQTYGPVQINAEDKTGTAKESAQLSVNTPKQNSPISMFGKNATGPAVNATNTSVNSPKQRAPIGMFGSNKTGPAVTSARSSVNSVKDKTVTIRANDQASGVIRGIKGWVDSLKDKVVNIFTRHTKNEKGTNYHPGGLAMVNDQKGPMYKELVTLPNGTSFIPQGRDVMLPLPRGSKVLKASRTKSLMEKLGVPKYRDGIGIPEDATFLKDIQRTQNQIQVVQADNKNSDEIVRLLREILLMMNRMKSTGNGDSPIYLDMDKVGQKVNDYINRRGVLANRLKGEV